jgi:hypothetical protein
MLSVLKFPLFTWGFKFWSCAIAVSVRWKTSRDASIKNSIVDTTQNRVFEMPVVFFIDASHEFVILDISPAPNASFSLFFSRNKIYFSSWPALPQKWQVINITAVHTTKSRGNASKKGDYLPFLLPLLFRNKLWDCIRCKIAKRGGVRSKERTQWFYEELASSVEFSSFFNCKSHGNAHNLLEVLHLLKFMANLIKFNK